MNTSQLLKVLTLFRDDVELLWALAKAHDIGTYETTQRYNEVVHFWELILGMEKIPYSESHQVKLQQITRTTCTLLLAQLSKISTSSNPLLLVTCQRTEMSPQALSQGLLYTINHSLKKTS